ncbi:MAG: hypothetical protein AMJ95_03230 [Omnitrophica WOR_2 bacterium SM23_72]|nr:MAG: hypothetical protein AMJ95_03230 [Omnitrophica WOR_2 bacterium SM23_72]
MKIDVRQVPQEGLVLTEAFEARTLDLETETIRFSGPLTTTAAVSKVAQALSVHLALSATLRCVCSRCLNEFETKLDKKFDLHYPVKDSEPVIDLNPDIREEIIIEYPIKSLCRDECQGLCPKCGKNLNEGKCGCV